MPPHLLLLSWPLRLPDTYLAEAAGLRFWAPQKETAEQLNVRRQERQLAVSYMGPLVLAAVVS